MIQEQYELHLTVPLGALENVDSFKQVCYSLGIKPLVPQLYNTNSGTEVMDVMTSSKYPQYPDVFQVVHEFAKRGYAVSRAKLETTPNYPTAPKTDSDQMPQGSYFESHLPVTGTQEQLEYLRAHLRELEMDGVHWSRNAFKAYTNGTSVQMITLRKYTGTVDEMKKDVERVSNWIEDNIPTISESIFTGLGKRVIEFIVMDTNIKHDDQWVK